MSSSINRQADSQLSYIRCDTFPETGTAVNLVFLKVNCSFPTVFRHFPAAAWMFNSKVDHTSLYI